VEETIQILSNDDFTDNTDGNTDPDNIDATSVTTIATVTGVNTTAAGAISYDPSTGELFYTPLSSEGGTTVTIEYQVCNDVSGDSPATTTDDVCDTAIVTITVAEGDQDGDGVLDSADICAGFDDTADADGDGIPDGCDLDDDNDGILDSVEDPCEVTNFTNQAGADWQHDGLPADQFFNPVTNNSALLNTALTGTEDVGPGLAKRPLSAVNLSAGFLTVSGATSANLADA